MADETATLPDEPDEIIQVRSWRLARLREIGYAEADARELSEAGIDVHAVQDLIGRGCDLPTAARIAR